MPRHCRSETSRSGSASPKNFTAVRKSARSDALNEHGASSTAFTWRVVRAIGDWRLEHPFDHRRTRSTPGPSEHRRAA